MIKIVATNEEDAPLSVLKEFEIMKQWDSHQFEYMTVTEPSVGNCAGNYAYSSDITPTFTFDVPKPLIQATQICFGPVRLHSEWWHDSPTKRDYFIAQTEQCVKLLVFKDEESRWWVQGLFC